MSVISKIIGTHSERELKRHNGTLEKVLAFKPEMEKLSEEQMKAKTEEFKKRLKEGETLDDILPSFNIFLNSSVFAFICSSEIFYISGLN